MKLSLGKSDNNCPTVAAHVMEIDRAELLQREPEVLLSEPSKLSLNRDCTVVKGRLNKTKTCTAFLRRLNWTFNVRDQNPDSETEFGP